VCLFSADDIEVVCVDDACFGAPSPSEADAKLISKAPEMAEMLRELEHVSLPGCAPMCPECSTVEPNHAQDCKLAALLRDLT
jgi:hypothetical protein